MPYYQIGRITVDGCVREQIVRVTGTIMADDPDNVTYEADDVHGDPDEILYEVDYGLLSTHEAVLEASELRDLTDVERSHVTAGRWTELPQQFHQTVPCTPDR